MHPAGDYKRSEQEHGNHRKRLNMPQPHTGLTLKLPKWEQSDQQNLPTQGGTAPPLYGSWWSSHPTGAHGVLPARSTPMAAMWGRAQLPVHPLFALPPFVPGPNVHPASLSTEERRCWVVTQSPNPTPNLCASLQNAALLQQLPRRGGRQHPPAVRHQPVCQRPHVGHAVPR